MQPTHSEIAPVQYVQDVRESANKKEGGDSAVDQARVDAFGPKAQANAIETSRVRSPEDQQKALDMGLNANPFNEGAPQSDSCEKPKYDLGRFQGSELNFSDAQHEIQDALDLIRQGKVKEGQDELRDAIKYMQGGLQDIHEGLLGKDGDLSKLPFSDPVRRIGSGRRGVVDSIDMCEEAVKLLSSDDPAVRAKGLEMAEDGNSHLLGGMANVNKAVGMLERGQDDHRPKEPTPIEPVIPQPVPPTPNPDFVGPVPPTPKPDFVGPVPPPKPDEVKEPEPLPQVYHGNEFNDGGRHLKNSNEALWDAISYVKQGKMDKAEEAIKYTLGEMREANGDLQHATNNQWTDTKDFAAVQKELFEALKNLNGDNYDQAMRDIHKALTGVQTEQSTYSDLATANDRG